MSLTTSSATSIIGEPEVVEDGRSLDQQPAWLALKTAATSLHDLLHVKDVGSGWHDSFAMMWSPATLIHGAKLSHGQRKELLGALGDDIVWNGEPITGMSAADAAALEDVHEQRV